MRKHWGFAAVIAAIAGFGAFVVYRWRTSGFSWNAFIESLSNVDWNWLALALVLILFTYLGRALRWEVMLRPLTHRSDFLRILSATCIGFTAVVLFGRAGEPVRPYLIARNEGVSFSSQIAAWVVERIMDIIMILMIFGIALTQVSGSAIPPGPRLREILQGGGAAAGIVGVISLSLLVGLRQFKDAAHTKLLAAVGFLPAPVLVRFSSFLVKFGHGMESTRTSSFTLLLIFYSFVEWVIIGACFYCIFRSFPATAGLGWTDIVIILGFVSFGSVFQIPGVGGGMQIVTVLVLTEFYGIAIEAATSVALVMWLINFAVIVPVGLALAFHEGLKWRTLRQISSTTDT